MIPNLPVKSSLATVAFAFLPKFQMMRSKQLGEIQLVIIRTFFASRNVTIYCVESFF